MLTARSRKESLGMSSEPETTYSPPNSEDESNKHAVDAVLDSPSDDVAANQCPYVRMESIKQIFHNLLSILNFHRGFMFQLETELTRRGSDSELSGLFADLRVLLEFSANIPMSFMTLDTLSKNSQFVSFLKVHCMVKG